GLVLGVYAIPHGARLRRWRLRAKRPNRRCERRQNQGCRRIFHHHVVIAFLPDGTFARWRVHSPVDGRVYAMYSPEQGPPLTATTMYCFPFTMYVIGEPLCGAGMYTVPTSFPLFLS